jgi:hypothetical protein
MGLGGSLELYVPNLAFLTSEEPEDSLYDKLTTGTSYFFPEQRETRSISLSLQLL